MILAPKSVRAGGDVNVRVIVTRMQYTTLTVRASVSRHDMDASRHSAKQLAQVSTTFTSPSRRLLRMKVGCDDFIYRNITKYNCKYVVKKDIILRYKKL